MNIAHQFASSENIDNALRPYTVGAREHSESLSTIVLYSNDFGGFNEIKNVNYNDSKNRTMVQGLSTLTTPEVNLADKVPSEIARINTKHPYGAKYFGVFNNFSLIQVEEAKDQIVKLHQNFGANWNIFFFGDTPNIYTFSGIFIDTWDYPYYQEFMTMFDKVLAGRKCIENKYKMKIIYDNKMVGGYLIKIRTMTAASTPGQKTFAFTVVVNSEDFMRYNLTLGSDNLHVHPKSVLNAMNNGHRVLRQYPYLLSAQNDSGSSGAPLEQIPAAGAVNIGSIA